MRPPISISIFDLFKIGPGPSSSHTIGPMKASLKFRECLEKLNDRDLDKATKVEARLYGSLSATGKGHGTDKAVAAGLLGLKPETCDPEEIIRLLANRRQKLRMSIRGHFVSFGPESIVFDEVQHQFPFHNTLVLRLLAGKKVIIEREYYSIGGGFVRCKGEHEPESGRPAFAFSNMETLKNLVADGQHDLETVLLENEKALTGRDRDQVYHEMNAVISVMLEAVDRGLNTEGVLPGPIGLNRKAPGLYGKVSSLKRIPDRFMVALNSYALAVSEENAASHRVVTAPTSGSSGVIPGVLYLLKNNLHANREQLIRGMLAATAIGFIAKHNASISGAEVGCQGEVGVASAMAAALLTHVRGLPIHSIENAAEIALEHHLGMTCDPIGGYVQIPCIERNAVAAVSAYNSYLIASWSDAQKQKIRFDQVVKSMLETGRDMSSKYKETAQGGLAVCSINC